MNLISKDEAKSRGLKKYFTGKPCKNGLIAERRVSTSNCLCEICQSKVRAKKRDHYQKNKNTDEFIEKSLYYRNKNKEMKREYDKLYYLKNKEKINKRASDWCKENRDRRRVVVKNYDSRRRSFKSNGLSSDELGSFIKNSDKECFYCGTSCENDFHVDHIIPLSRGGEHKEYNLCIACPTCNLRKGALDPEDFIDRLLNGYYDSYK